MSENLAIEETITEQNSFKVCFVCLGNICRSPTAEGVFQHLVNEEGLEDFFVVDSAGTSAYHIGESANKHSQHTARQHGINLHSKARQFRQPDLDEFDLILAMDNENSANVKGLADERHTSKIAMLRDFDPQPDDGQVPDPYAGGAEGFENVFQIVKRSCKQLLNELKPHININQAV